MDLNVDCFVWPRLVISGDSVISCLVTFIFAICSESVFPPTALLIAESSLQQLFDCLCVFGPSLSQPGTGNKV